MNLNKYENDHVFTDIVTPNNINIKKRSNINVLESLDNVTNVESKIKPSNNQQNIEKCTIYKEIDKEEAVLDSQDSSDNESYSDITSISDESEITNVTTRSLSTEFSSFSLYEKNASENRNKLHLVSSRKKQFELRNANKTFTIEQLKEIERENRILMHKILNIKVPQNKIKSQYVQTMYSCSAINRKKIQKKIEEENMILLKKIQHAKPHVILH